MLASRLGEARSPLIATLMHNGIYSATPEIILSIVIGAFRNAAPPRRRRLNEAILRDRARYDFQSCSRD